MRELAVQASNDTNITNDRTAITDEMTSLASEINRIATKTTFNQQELLDGTLTAVNLQIGADAGVSMTLSIGTMTTTGLGITSIDVTGFTNANTSLTAINTAIENVSTQRSKLGANQNRLEHTIKNLDNASENLQAAESRIRDVDMAKEMMEFSKNNILSQAAQAMLAQANQAPQGVLQLLR
jgi:flagellin